MPKFQVGNLLSVWEECVPFNTSSKNPTFLLNHKIWRVQAERLKCKFPFRMSQLGQVFCEINNLGLDELLSSVQY